MKSNAYGARLVAVSNLRHPQGLKWTSVTWSVDGKSRWAKTVPGGEVNDALVVMAEKVAHDERGLAALGSVNVILNGRNQVVHVEPVEDPSAPQPKSLTPETIKQSDIDALVTFVTDCASGGYLNTPATARALLRALNLPKEG